MNNRYFVIGGGALQQDFVETVKQMGFETHVFDYNPDALCSKVADVFHVISIDAKEEILKIALKYKPVAIQTAATEMGNISACYVGEKMGLCTNSYNTALNTTDKSRMKKIMAEKGIPSAKYLEIKDIEELELSFFNYPIVVKPADRSASRGVMKVNDKDGLYAAFVQAMNESHNKKVLIEEFLEGTQYSVETISSNGKHQVVAITEETFDGTDNLIETRHMIPAELSDANYQELADLANKTLNAFDIRYGASHIELRRTNTGPKIIEIASRTGGLRDFMINHALGCDYNRLLINSSLGRTVHVEHLKKNFVVSVFLIRESDFELYKKMKASTPEKIIREHIYGLERQKEPKTLMDSQGWFYLLFDNAEEARNILKRERL